MTQVFKDFYDFLDREDKDMNGVSETFAANHPGWEADNESNKGCWNCSDCSDCSDCYDCSRCYRCSRCHDCYLKNGLHGDNNAIQIPVIEGIHTKVLEAVNAPNNNLDMSDWHTCDTTHCRAGWVVHLAGKAGYDLEKQTSTLFAAMQIYKNSSLIRVSPVRFFDSNPEAMKDMKACAEKEASTL